MTIHLACADFKGNSCGSIMVPHMTLPSDGVRAGLLQHIQPTVVLALYMTTIYASNFKRIPIQMARRDFNV
jgi:hypothetical protein